MRISLGLTLAAISAMTHPSAPRAPAPTAQRMPRLRARAFCSGTYTDDLSLAPPLARDLVRGRAPFTFCVRSIATYECLSHASDGTARRWQHHAAVHGTAFAFRRQARGTLVLTNAHVADWPSTLQLDAEADGGKADCHLVSRAIKIVESETDANDRDDLALTRVVSDPRLDVAVLRSRATLPVLPWAMGRSAALRERDVLYVAASSQGTRPGQNVDRVARPVVRDERGGWSHDDFVLDTTLPEAWSGSPVFAASCASGQLELVGVLHAAASRGDPHSVAVGIDEVSRVLATLRRTPRRLPPLRWGQRFQLLSFDAPQRH
jgi:serine protease Do